MALWSVRVVLAGKGLSLYDIMVGRDDGCMEREQTWFAISKECDEHMYGYLMIM